MKGVFTSVFAIILLFNMIYVNMNPETTYNIYVGAVTGLIATSISVGVLGGISILGSGLNSESIKILFGTSTLLNALFQIQVGAFPVGIGLATNIINIFTESDFVGLGFFISTALAVIALISGLIIIIGGSE